MKPGLVVRDRLFGAPAAADVEPDGFYGREFVGKGVLLGRRAGRGIRGRRRNVFVSDGDVGCAGGGVGVHEFGGHDDVGGGAEVVGCFGGAVGILLATESGEVRVMYPFIEISISVRSLPDAKKRSPWYLQPLTSSLLVSVRTV